MCLAASTLFNPDLGYPGNSDFFRQGAQLSTAVLAISQRKLMARPPTYEGLMSAL